MMNISRKILIATAAATTVSAVASAALAADNTANANVAINAKIIAPITITAGNALNFGTIFNSAAGTVIISAEGARSGTASYVSTGTAAGTIGNATFTVGGTDAQLFDVSYSPSVTGYTVDSFTTTGCGKTDSASLTGYTTSSSTCTLNVGATLHVPANATAGSVSGTLTTTVTYE
jgi:hypothetical protein